MTKLIRGEGDWLQADTRVVATLGNFDGIHIGHQSILRAVQECKEHYRASGEQVRSLVISFDPHPVEVLGQVEHVPRLTNHDQKCELLADFDIDFLYLIAFTVEFSKISAERFVKEILFDTLRVSDLFLGPDAAVGYKRRGTVSVLAEHFEDAQRKLNVVDFTERSGVKVGSGQIRQAIAAGDVVQARELLGRPYCLRGRVASGDKRGRTLGFPTANMGHVDQMLPSKGVYAAIVRLQEKSYRAVVNIGTRPTFTGGDVLVETHLLDYGGSDFYGSDLDLVLHERIRSEHKFSSREELVEQIGRDVLRARTILAGIL